MRGIYRGRVVVQTVLGPQQAEMQTEAADLWEAATWFGALFRKQAVAGETPSGPVIVLGVECIGFIAPKRPVLGPDGMPLPPEEVEAITTSEVEDVDESDVEGDL